MQDSPGQTIDASGNGTKAQTHLYVENYGATELWGKLEDTSLAEEHRVESFVDFLHLSVSFLMCHPGKDSLQQSCLQTAPQRHIAVPRRALTISQRLMRGREFSDSTCHAL